jgi:hypothetical protein
MKSFTERTQEDLNTITRRTARAYTDGEVTLVQHKGIIQQIAIIEGILREVEEQNGE